MLRKILLYAASVAVVLGAVAAFGSEVREFNIPPGELAPALESLAKETGLEVIFEPEKLKGIQTHGVTGKLSPQEAVERLVDGTGLRVKIDVAGAILISRNSAEDEAGTGVRLAQATATTDTSEGANAYGVNPQSASQGTRDELQEVVVTAQKREERLQDVPVPVTVLDAQHLAETGQALLRDYYTSVPGFSVSPNIENAQMLSIRGVSTGGFSNPTVGVMIDGVPFGSSIQGGHEIPDIDPSDLARIEVLRGPQGSLYGASSMGGLLNFVTVDPSADTLTGRIEAGTSTVFNGAEPGYNVRAALNIPVTSTLAVRISGFDRQDPGYIDNPLLNLAGVNESETQGGRLSSLWTPADWVSLKLSALYQHVKGNGLSEVNKGPGLGDLQQNYVSGAGRYETTVQAYSAVLNIKMGGATLTSVTGYNVNKHFANFDFTPFFGTNTQSGIPGTGFNGYGVKGTILQAGDNTSNFTQELRLAMALGQRFDWLLGGFLTHENIPSSDTVIATDPSTGQYFGTTYDDHFPATYDEVAAFTDITYHATDQFDIQVGGRQSHLKSTYALTCTGVFCNLLNGAPSPEVIPTAGATANAFTYLVTPKYKLTPDMMVYARFASGYRPGGPNSGAPGAPPTYSPDKTENYEVGFKGDFLDHRISLDASAYYIDWKNLQLQLFLPTGYSYFANGSAAKSQGLELAGNFIPADGLSVSAWVAYDEAELTQAFPAASTAYGQRGDNLPNAPRFSGNVSVTEEFPLWGGVTGFVGGTAAVVGGRYSVFTNTADRQYFPSYTKTDLRAGTKFDSWTVTAYVNNLTNNRALINGGVGYIAPDAYVYITPRTIGLTLSKSFR